ncbi:MAG: S8 family serine peptidase [Promethearchaeota archaeon]
MNSTFKNRIIILIFFFGLVSIYLPEITCNTNPSHSFITVEGKTSFPNNDLSWNLKSISVDGAWELTNGSKAVTIAIIDSGIDFSIPNLQGSNWINKNETALNGIDDDNNGYIDDITGWDFVSVDNTPYEGDSHWHGSYVANWAKEVAPNVSIMDLRILDSENSFNGSFWKHIVAAVNYSINMDADVINLSIWCYGVPPSSFHDILKRAIAEGIVIVGTTGNTWDDSSTKGVQYPGKFPEVIATSSISSNQKISTFSRKGPENEICAPGENLAPLGSIRANGTSFAAPHVCGCIALMKSINKSLTPVDVRTILASTANDKGLPGRDESYGYGLLNVTNAVRGAAGLQIWNYTMVPVSTTTDDITRTATTSKENSSTMITTTTETSTSHQTNFLILEMICIVFVLLRKKKRT